jgi:hypothetical protein
MPISSTNPVGLQNSSHLRMRASFSSRDSRSSAAPSGFWLAGSDPFEVVVVVVQVDGP